MQELGAGITATATSTTYQETKRQASSWDGNKSQHARVGAPPYRKLKSETLEELLKQVALSKAETLVMLPNRRHLVVATENGLCVWEIVGHTYKCTVAVKLRRPIYRLVALWGGHFASVNQKGKLRIWEVTQTSDGETGLAWVISFGKVNARVQAMIWSHNSYLAAVADGDFGIQLWDGNDGCFKGVLAGRTRHTGHISNIQALAGLSNGFLASAAAAGTVHIWDPARCGSESAHQTMFTVAPHRIQALVGLPNEHLAIATEAGVFIWNTRDLFCEIILAKESSFYALTTLPCGRFVGLGASGLHIWNTSNYSTSKVLPTPSRVKTLAAMDDGGLAICFDDGKISFLQNNLQPMIRICVDTFKAEQETKAVAPVTPNHETKRSVSRLLGADSPVLASSNKTRKEDEKTPLLAAVTQAQGGYRSA